MPDTISGTWGSDEAGHPHLTFRDDETYVGSDGCNPLNGGYELDGSTVRLHANLTTLKACFGVRTWLFRARTLEIDGDGLRVFDADGTEIGALVRED